MTTLECTSSHGAVHAHVLHLRRVVGSLRFYGGRLLLFHSLINERALHPLRILFHPLVGESTRSVRAHTVRSIPGFRSTVILLSLSQSPFVRRLSASRRSNERHRDRRLQRVREV